MSFYITGTRRGLGKVLAWKFGNTGSMQHCDVFINCKHNDFDQVDMLYKAHEAGVKRIINIGSNSPDETKRDPHIYAVQKAALDAANDQLFYQGVNTTNIRFGWFDSERVAHIDAKKLDMDYCAEVVQWVVDQPHRIKDITVCR